MKRSLNYLLLFIFYFFAAMACNDSVGPKKLEGCERDTDCLGGRSCIDSRCVEVEDVGPNDASDGGRDSGADASLSGVCDNTECAIDEVCYRGICYPHCISNAECDDDARCYDNHCAPLNCEGVQCLDAEVCYRGVCYPTCFEDGGCSHSLSCTSGGCVDPCEEAQCASDQLCYRGGCYDFCDGQASCDDEHRCHDNSCLPTDCSTVDCRDDETCYFGACYSSCLDDDDCQDPDQRCEAQACVISSCDDGVKNGDETDVDCGGDCKACALKQSCVEDDDCQSGVCLDAQCAECTDDHHCSDGEICQANECILCDPARSPFGGGAGSIDDPYRICSPLHFDSIREELSAHFKLYDDIDLSEITNFEPIGDSYKFSGSLDGDEFAIRNLSIDTPDRARVALFRYVRESGRLSNIRLIDVDITGQRNVGGLVSENRGEIENSHITGKISGENYYVGGLVSENRGKIKNSYISGEVSGKNYVVGGLVASNYGEIESSYATGEVSGESYYVGGLVGSNSGVIENSYASNQVSGERHSIGGLAGKNYDKIENSYAIGEVSGGDSPGGLVGSNAGEIKNSYATGQVSGGHSVGGFVGLNTGAIENSYATGQATGDRDVGGFVGVNGSDAQIANSYWNQNLCSGCENGLGASLTAQEFEVEASFVGWAFGVVWKMGDIRPRLIWEED